MGYPKGFRHASIMPRPAGRQKENPGSGPQSVSGGLWTAARVTSGGGA
jgi:hypothetical protein